MRYFSLFILVIMFLEASFVYGGCPSPYSILPCTCEIDNEGETIITCERVQCSEELLSAMTAAKKQKISVVQLKAVSFMFFPDGLFTDTKVKILRIKDSSIFLLGGRNPAFSGLEDSLKTLEVSNCTYVNKWDWSELSNMKNLRYLRISESELLELPSFNISHLPIEDLNLRRNFISELPLKCFSGLTQLKRLTLDGNDIIGIMRSMFPIPAKNLEAIGLSYNKITFLPINTFDQMPALKYLYLGGNPIQVLKEEIFKPVWSHLQMAFFQDCPLICDCQIAWITKAKQSKVILISGKCESPENFKGKRITHLLPAQFQYCKKILENSKKI